MMASFMSYFGAGRKDPKQTARDAIVGLRQQLQMIEKKEEYLQRKIEEETKKARANAVSNKAGTSFLGGWDSGRRSRLTDNCSLLFLCILWIYRACSIALLWLFICCLHAVLDALS